MEVSKAAKQPQWDCSPLSPFAHCVVPENIHTLPMEGIGISRGVGGQRPRKILRGGEGCCINLYDFFQTGSIIPIC